LIITKLIGGIGNQMFQYAVARHLAYLQNDQLKLDLTGFREYTLRSYHLNPLNIIEQVATDDEITYLRNLHYVNERHFHFNPAILNLGTNVYLEGYWQSEKYFKNIEAVIRNEFKAKCPPEGENARLANQIVNCDAVAMHVRRGDYAANPVTNQVHGLCQLDYYYRAVSIIANRVSQPCFYVFSDDWGWVRQNVSLQFPMTIITHNANWPHEDLRLMSLCKYHIIANSTFSWWGAWLADYLGKVVIAPQKWFNAPGKYTGDLFPENWILI
jgi:hypothetical protein